MESKSGLLNSLRTVTMLAVGTTAGWLTRSVAHRSLSQETDILISRPKLRARCFELIEAAGMAQVEQSVDLWQVPAQTACQVGLFDALFHHGLVDAQLGAFKC